MLLALVKMSRPVNIVIAMVTLVIGYYLLSALPTTAGGIEWISLILQALGFAFAIAFANIQNDIWDLDSDRLNRPERPLVSGEVSVAAARRAWIILLVLTIAVGLADSLMTKTNGTTCIFFVLLSALLVAYNTWLKHIPLLKNMTVAFLCATPLILCLFYPTGLKASIESTLGISNKIGLLYPAMLFAFLLTTAREIYKDLEDETGDLKAGIMTFPLIAGAPTARRLAGFICIFCWVILPLLERTTTLIILRPESKGASPMRGRLASRSRVVNPIFAASATRAASVGSPTASCSTSSHLASEHSAMVRTSASMSSPS